VDVSINLGLIFFLIVQLMQVLQSGSFKVKNVTDYDIDTLVTTLKDATCDLSQQTWMVVFLNETNPEHETQLLSLTKSHMEQQETFWKLRYCLGGIFSDDQKEECVRKTQEDDKICRNHKFENMPLSDLFTKEYVQGLLTLEKSKIVAKYLVIFTPSVVFYEGSIGMFG
jgi:hypothetical protein